ncbi:MAG TPA: ABC transporter substrate-binding protein [Planctomycetaceae bacterium]|jgi:ABC-type transport system substrate-binding protein|nr:ABC transporter substrate-binding protein [Planctomycetaceae bacterium]
MKHVLRPALLSIALRHVARRAAVLCVALMALGLVLDSAAAFQKPDSRGVGRERPQRPPKPPKDSGPPQKREKQQKEPEDKEKKEDGEEAKAEAKRLQDLKNEQKLPRLDELSVPTVAELSARPVDWLVLAGGNPANPDVLVVKQVFPRPDTLKKLAAALEELRKRPRPATPDERQKLESQKVDLQHLIVTLPNDAHGQIYEIPTSKIDRIIYHEDLTIRRAGLLADEKKFRDALELLYPLERTAPTWAGLQDESRRMLMKEAEANIQTGDSLTAWMSLMELRTRDRAYAGLQTQLGAVTDRLIESARKAHDDREVRHYLGQLARIEPQHETVEKWKRALQAEAETLIGSALQDAREQRCPEAVTTIDRAAHIWPKAIGLAEAHRTICERYQRLAIGTMSLGGDELGLPWPTPADQRATRLEQFDLFEVDRVDDSTHYRSRLLEQWEPTDLGRKALFTLRRTRARWESRPNLTAATFMATLRAMIDPAGPAFDERFASYIDAVQLRSPLELEIRFSHAPPRMEPLFRFPISAPGGAMSNMNSSRGSGLGRVLSRRFERSERSADDAVFRRVYPQPDGLDQYQVAEVKEHRYDSPQHEIQALLRGDVSMLIDLPPWAVDAVRKDTRFFILDYAIPTTHVLQLNPNSQALKSRELRLALSYAIDVQRILSDRILRRSDSSSGRLSTAPFATTSYAYNGLLTRREFNANMAFSLRAAAVKRLKNIPPLRLVCERDLEAESAVTELVAAWKRVGITVEVVHATPRSETPQGSRKVLAWDIAYRKLRMEEPQVDLWPFLTVDSGARLESVRTMPDWLRIELLDLDSAPDWKSAINRLQTLHAHLYAEVAYIPLWEVDDTIVLRKNVRDFPPFKFVNAYQDVERWIVQSWFPEDEP